MTTDDTGQSDPYGLPVPEDDELAPNEPLGQPQDREPGLDADGLTVRDQLKTNHTVQAIAWLVAIAVPVLGAVSAGIAIRVSGHERAGNLVGLGKAASWLAMSGFFLAFLVASLLDDKYAKTIFGSMMGGVVFGVIGSLILSGLPNCPCSG